jgi:predicted heme/steroid binding protein
LINWSLANYDDDTISNEKLIDQNFIMPPKSYAVLTTDSNFQIMQYPYAVPGKFVQMESLPSYNNDSSTIYITYFGQVMDKVSYSDEWHFGLLQSEDGVSLERFNFELESNDSSNWHSASETVGFGTPGGDNSQRIDVGAPEGEITLSSTSFSPDGDGFQDALLITYKVGDPTLLGDLVIYDDMGRLVKVLLKDHLLGANGTVKWDGINEEGKKASIGPHIIFFSFFNVNEATNNVKRKVVTVAGQL